MVQVMGFASQSHSLYSERRKIAIPQPLKALLLLPKNSSGIFGAPKIKVGSSPHH